MTGNVAIDVFVSLAFIYLTYSLLASGITEIIATNLGLRGKNLKVTIIKMLGADPEPTGRFASLWKLTWWCTEFIRAGKHKSTLVDDFFADRQIRALQTGSLARLPDTMQPETFAAVVFRVYHYRKKTAPVPTPYDLEGGHEGGHATPAGEPLSRPVSLAFRHLASLEAAAGGDPTKFKTALADWFGEMSNHTKSWYKRRIQVLLFLVGLAIASLVGLDAHHVTRVLMDSHTAHQVAEMAGKVVNKENGPDSLTAALQQQLIGATHELGSLLGVGMIPDSVVVHTIAGPTGQQRLSEQKHEAILWDGQLYRVKSAPGVTANRLTYFLDPAAEAFLSTKAKIQPAANEQITLGLSRYQPRHWLGYILSSLAISLGAPFWFKLLNQLTVFRAALNPVSGTSGRQKPPQQAAP